VKDLYNENYKAVNTEIEEDSRKWKRLPMFMGYRINIVKMALLLVMVNLDCQFDLFEECLSD
jgi:hypothetical protein